MGLGFWRWSKDVFDHIVQCPLVYHVMERGFNDYWDSIEFAVLVCIGGLPSYWSLGLRNFCIQFCPSCCLDVCTCSLGSLLRKEQELEIGSYYDLCLMFCCYDSMNKGICNLKVGVVCTSWLLFAVMGDGFESCKQNIRKNFLKKNRTRININIYSCC